MVSDGDANVGGSHHDHPSTMLSKPSPGNRHISKSLKNRIIKMFKKKKRRKQRSPSWERELNLESLLAFGEVAQIP